MWYYASCHKLESKVFVIRQLLMNRTICMVDSGLTLLQKCEPSPYVQQLHQTIYYIVPHISSFCIYTDFSFYMCSK